MAAMVDRRNIQLNTVVYATDLSLTSQNAEFYAAHIAAHFSAGLLVAHAFTLSQAAMEVEAAHSQLSQQRLHLKSRLSKKSCMLRSESVEPIPALLDGDPKDVVPELADVHAPSMIVLGAHGTGKLERCIIGSVAEQIIWSTGWPSFIVGPHVRPASSATWPIKRILYITDLTTSANRVAEFAACFAETLGSEVDVLSVIGEEAFSHPDRIIDLQSHCLSAFIGRWSADAMGFRDLRSYVTAKRSHDRILEYIKERSIDLVVLGIRKATHLGMKMKRSEVFQLIIDAECPVLTIRT